jgi:hypothetical protein
MAWSPFPISHKFVGTGGSLNSSNVSGFLMGQNGNQFGSLLTMTATTPSTATIAPTGTVASGGPLVYTLGADSITNISYTNVYKGAYTSLTLTSTSNAIVSIDGTTGFVDFVAPGMAVKGPTAAVQKAGAASYMGRFAAIYDQTGTNIAPSGATSIQVDSTTGRLISFR